jgi:hypothetical protein
MPRTAPSPRVRLLSALSAGLLLVLGTLIVAASLPSHLGANVGYPDVSTDRADYKAIIDVQLKGVMTGYGNGNFGPDDTLKRAELAAILVRAKVDAQTIDSCVGPTFPDIDPAAWYAKYVCAAKQKGYIAGYPDGTFGPGNEINAAEVSKIMALAFELPLTTQAASPELWYMPYVDALAEAHAIPSSLRKAEQLETRGEVAQTLSILLRLPPSDLHGAAPAEPQIQQQDQQSSVDLTWLTEAELRRYQQAQENAQNQPGFLRPSSHSSRSSSSSLSASSEGISASSNGAASSQTQSSSQGQGSSQSQASSQPASSSQATQSSSASSTFQVAEKCYVDWWTMHISDDGDTMSAIYNKYSAGGGAMMMYKFSTFDWRRLQPSQYGSHSQIGMSANGKKELFLDRYQDTDQSIVSYDWDTNAYTHVDTGQHPKMSTQDGQYVAYFKNGLTVANVFQGTKTIAATSYWPPMVMSANGRYVIYADANNQNPVLHDLWTNNKTVFTDSFGQDTRLSDDSRYIVNDGLSIKDRYNNITDQVTYNDHDLSLKGMSADARYYLFQVMSPGMSVGVYDRVTGAKKLLWVTSAQAGGIPSAMSPNGKAIGIFDNAASVMHMFSIDGTELWAKPVSCPI